MITIYEVFIDNLPVDIINDDFEIPLILQVYDVASFGSIASNYSKTVTIPKTDNNCKIFGFSDMFESSSTKPYSKLPIRVIKNGIEIISNGWCYISGVDTNFELTIFYGNYNFFSTIENKKLDELDTSDIDHIWNYISIRDSSFGLDAFSKDYIYPLVEWGDQILMIPDLDNIYSDGQEFNLEALLPVINIKYLINRIINEAGYECIDVDSLLDYFDDKYITLVNLLADEIVDEEIRTAEALRSNWYNIHLYPVSLPTWGAITYETIVQDYFGQLANVPHADDNPIEFTRYRVGCKCALRCHAVVVFSDFAFEGTAVINVGIGVHNGQIYYTEGGEEYPQYTMIYNEEATITGSIGPVVSFTVDSDYITRDNVSIIVEIISWPEGFARQIRVESASLSFDYPETKAETTGYGYHLTIGKNLPALLQKDFIKHILTLRNIVLSTNYHDKVIYLTEFDKIFDNMSIAKDWSNKLDITEQPKINYLPEGFFKRNYLRYGSPDAKENKNLDIGMSYFDIPNENLESDDTFYQSIFDASIKVRRSIFRFPVLQINIMDIYYNVIGASPRILIVKEKTFGRSYNFVSEVQEISSAQDKLLFSIFVAEEQVQEDLVGIYDFDFEHLLSLYYQKLINMLQAYKSGEFKINLTDADISDFNHLIPVWIEKYHSYFYVNAIKDYIDGLTLCELIKLY